jgi:hypothetical protein
LRFCAQLFTLAYFQRILAHFNIWMGRKRLYASIYKSEVKKSIIREISSRRKCAFFITLEYNLFSLHIYERCHGGGGGVDIAQLSQINTI